MNSNAAQVMDLGTYHVSPWSHSEGITSSNQGLPPSDSMAEWQHFACSAWKRLVRFRPQAAVLSGALECPLSTHCGHSGGRSFTFPTEAGHAPRRRPLLTH